jgi:hypothetical protein
MAIGRVEWLRRKRDQKENGKVEHPKCTDPVKAGATGARDTQISTWRLSMCSWWPRTATCHQS